MGIIQAMDYPVKPASRARRSSWATVGDLLASPINKLLVNLLYHRQALGICFVSPFDHDIRLDARVIGNLLPEPKETSLLDLEHAPCAG